MRVIRAPYLHRADISGYGQMTYHHRIHPTRLNGEHQGLYNQYMRSITHVKGYLGSVRVCTGFGAEEIREFAGKKPPILYARLESIIDRAYV